MDGSDRRKNVAEERDPREEELINSYNKEE